MKYLIVVSEFNAMITQPMLEACLRGFKEQAIDAEVLKVPGAAEIPLVVQEAIVRHKPAAVVALGAIIKGETEHYKAVCEWVTQSLANIALKEATPVIFEVLMTDTYQKAEARIEKGYHAAFVATRMAHLLSEL